MIQRLVLFAHCTLVFLFSVSAQTRATESISDSINITHFNLAIRITDYTSQTISGNAGIYFKAKVDGISEIPLDLLGLTVDSVIDEDGNEMDFEQVGGKLYITLSSTLNTNDSTFITVNYGGQPEADASWGGWYWSGDYSYQLGVGFVALPHNFGRVWFPCFDNFVERSTFRFEVTTPGDKKAFCGGILESEITNADDTKTWIWNLNQQIPSYLASVAVSTYSTVNMNYAGVERNIPIEIAVKAEDSIDLKNSFVHLQDALSAYEENYGPYMWDRVGYAVVPFSGGAMEHAMNIAYPLFAVNGNTSYESLMVHELSHHWWGNLITCGTAEEMWLNEGWASYSEFIFTEYLYGAEAYKEAVKANHTYILHYAAQNDGGNYFALSSMPESYTYGTTTYKKGADVISTLRTYMGDENFFSCIASFLDAYQFQPVTAAQLRDHLSTCSGTDLTSFFNNWVYAPGSAAFEVESVHTTSGMTDGVCIEQKLKHTPAFYTDVPLTLSFLDENWNVYHEENIMMSGEHEGFSFPAITTPYAVVIDYAENISDAVTEDEIKISAPGSYYLPNAFVTVVPDAVSDTAIIYAQQYWVGADNFKTTIPGLHVNTQRYWKFQGVIPGGFHATATIKYNGKEGTAEGNQDNEFITNSEDSLVLLYRANPDAEWEIYSAYTLNDFGPDNDKFGQFELSTFQLGEYTIGMYDASVADAAADVVVYCTADAIEEDASQLFSIFPNPATETCTVKLAQAHKVKVEIFDSLGNRVRYFEKEAQVFQLDLHGLAAGVYEIKCTSVDNKAVATEKLVINR